jgi:Family of unknown function (DUF6390)
MKDGASLFARFAYPPNALGYCGPGDSVALREYASVGTDDGGMRDLARRFEGAWPYLALIAAASGQRDPLDTSVVEAYWVGGPLLERVPAGLLAAHLDERFAHRAGRHSSDLATLALLGGRAHHNFHVFAVYPWVGMLRAGYTEEPLRVLDSCRVRWGTITGFGAAGTVAIRTRPLCWDGRALTLGPMVEEQAHAGLDSAAAAAPALQVGDRVAIHWGWVCDVLDSRRLAQLRHYTASQLRLVNKALNRPVAAALLE